MTATEAIKIIVDLQGHVFEITAYMLDLGESLDLTFGVKSATEVEGNIDFVNQEFSFKQRSIPVKTTKTITVPPKQSLNYAARLEKCSKDFESGEIMLKLRNDRDDKLPKMLWVTCTNGEFRLLIKNLINKELIFDEGSMIGTADMRSVRYFYLSRSTIQKAVEGRFVLISETDDEVLLQANEELVQANEKDLVKELHKVPRPPLKGQLGSCLNIKLNQEKSDQKEVYC